MSVDTITNAINTRFKTQWGVTTPIEWPNVPKTAGVTKPYVRCSINFLQSQNAAIGGNLIKYRGTIIISIFTAVNIGVKSANELAASALNKMQNAQFSGIFTYAGQIRTIGKDPANSDLWMVNVWVPFEAIL